MNKYIKGYSLGVLLGLLFCSSAFVVDVSFSFKQHWYTLVIFLPAVLYFIFSYSEYNEVSFKKENIKKSIPFIIGLVLSSYAIYSIWGLPYLWKKFNLIKSSEKQKSQETLLNQHVSCLKRTKKVWYSCCNPINSSHFRKVMSPIW